MSWPCAVQSVACSDIWCRGLVLTLPHQSSAGGGQFVRPTVMWLEWLSWPTIGHNQLMDMCAQQSWKGTLRVMQHGVACCQHAVASQHFDPGAWATDLTSGFTPWGFPGFPCQHRAVTAYGIM
jgi:hypothetical protein